MKFENGVGMESRARPESKRVGSKYGESDAGIKKKTAQKKSRNVLIQKASRVRPLGEKVMLLVSRLPRNDCRSGTRSTGRRNDK